ncbi:hypothetical protein HHI36_007706 [Cryptolaemus montrouzieri]|uniref:Uncharacterized protein n=1 Tax=Cryptolaemus montrouzieri TaxID=559131 RepID=A0ABD2MQ99_9CUCU
MPSVEMGELQIVNGNQLPNHVGGIVSLLGYVNGPAPNALTFELRTTDNVMVKVNLKRPLDKPIDGYVEVRGIYQNRAVTASDLIKFSNKDFDAEGHNTLCSLWHSMSNIWKTRN